MLPVSKLDKLENVKIKEVIVNYFNELNRKNRDFADKTNGNRTADTYETDIRMYFHLQRQKPKTMELEYLTLEDISITQDDFEEYLDKLYSLTDEQGNLKYVNKTIAKKISALKSFLKFLKKKKVIDVDISYLELIKGEKGKKNSYGCLEPSEIIRMSELCLEERNKKEVKRALILFAFKTGLRIAELLSLTWDSFITKGDEIFVKGIGKGNKPFEIKIPNDLYEELQLLNNGKTNKVFDISSRRVTDLMESLRTKMDIPASRNIVFHSIRKCFGTIIWKSHDLEAARRALRHENISTTQVYLGELDFEVTDSIFSIEKIQEDLYKTVSAEDLLKAIENCPKNIQLILNMKIHEVLKSQNE